MIKLLLKIIIFIIILILVLSNNIVFANESEDLYILNLENQFDSIIIKSTAEQLGFYKFINQKTIDAILKWNFETTKKYYIYFLENPNNINNIQLFELIKNQYYQFKIEGF